MQFSWYWSVIHQSIRLSISYAYTCLYVYVYLSNTHKKIISVKHWCTANESALLICATWLYVQANLKQLNISQVFNLDHYYNLTVSFHTKKLNQAIKPETYK